MWIGSGAGSLPILLAPPHQHCNVVTRRSCGSRTSSARRSGPAVLRGSRHPAQVPPARPLEATLRGPRTSGSLRAAVRVCLGAPCASCQPPAHCDRGCVRLCPAVTLSLFSLVVTVYFGTPKRLPPRGTTNSGSPAGTRGPREPQDQMNFNYNYKSLGPRNWWPPLPAGGAKTAPRSRGESRRKRKRAGMGMGRFRPVDQVAPSGL